MYGYKSCQEKAEDAAQFVRDQIAEHRRTFDPSNPRDFIDSFLIEKGKAEDCEDSAFIGKGRIIYLSLQAYLLFPAARIIT